MSSIVNPETRTAVVYAKIDNTNRQLKLGMLATMLAESEPVDILTIPSKAVVRDDNTDHIFVKVNNDTYRMVHVKVSPEVKRQGLIYPGIEPGQLIIIKGAYHLNTKRKRQLSGG